MENKHNNSNKSVHVLFLIDLVTWHNITMEKPVEGSVWQNHFCCCFRHIVTAAMNDNDNNDNFLLL